MDIGLQLRSARERKGLTIAALARTTRVQSRILEAIERNDSHALPPRPYGRGSVRAYAIEVGLEPEATVREFFAQFGGPSAAEEDSAVRPGPAEAITPAESRRRALIGTVLTCSLAAAIVIFLGRAMLTSGTESGPVATIGVTAPVAASTAGVTPPAETTTPPPAPLVVTLEAAAPAWITAFADGQRVVYRTMQPGEREVLHAEEQVRLRIGDAGAVQWQINGRQAGLMGAPGAVRTVVVTGANAATVK